MGMSNVMDEKMKVGNVTNGGVMGVRNKINESRIGKRLVLVSFSLLFILALSSFVLAQFAGGVNQPSFSGGYRVIGPSSNPQFTNPNFFSAGGFTPANVYWPKMNQADCRERQDIIMQIAPGGCSPSVVRSDLLEEQNVPVFCKVMAIQVNPLIDITKIRALRFPGKTPEGVQSISYYPARVAINSQRNLISSPLEDNLGYLVVVLSRQASEEDMPDFVEGTVTAVVDYDAEGAFGIGNTQFYVPELSNEEWLREYQQYGFWNGKGYVRADSIDGNQATISIYRDADTRQSTITLRKGETSRDVHLSGFYCGAGMNVKLESIDAPVETALLQINDEKVWVAKNDRIINGKCRVRDIDIKEEKKSSGNSSEVDVSISCPVADGSFNLLLKTDENQEISDEFKGDSLARKYYDDAINSYTDLGDFYPNDKRIDSDNSLEPYAAEGLFNAAELSRKFGMMETAKGFYDELITDYPDSSYAVRARDDRDKLLTFDYSDSKVVINVNNKQYFIDLLSFEKPSKEDLGVVLDIGSKREVKLKLDELYEDVDIDKGVSSLKVIEIEDDFIKIEYTKEDSSLSSSKSVERIEEGKSESLEQLRVRVVNIELKNQVKLSFKPLAFGPRTQSNFSFKVGIEKRGIKLSPEKTRELIDNMEENIEKWSDVNEKLGKVVKGMKAACFATSTALTVKNLFTGFSGESLARNDVMTKPNGWNDKCEGLVNQGKYNSINNCLLGEEDNIDADIEDYKKRVDGTNGELEDIQKNLPDEFKSKSDLFDLQGAVDHQEIKKKYCNNVFKGFYEDNKNENVKLSGIKNPVPLSDIVPQSKVNDCDVNLEDMKNLVTYYQLGQSKSGDENSVLNGLIENDLGKSLRNTYDSNQYDKGSEEMKVVAGKFTSEAPLLNVENGKSVITDMHSLSDSEKSSLKFGSDVSKVVYYKVPMSVGDVENGVKSVDSAIAGKNVAIGFSKVKGDIYSIKEVRFIENDESKVPADLGSGDDPGGKRKVVDLVKSHIRELGANPEKFREANSRAYENEFRDKKIVKYFERDPYKGMPAEIPFDIEKGWYVELTYVLSGFGKPYDESGRPVNYYICNVGPDGMIDFKRNDDDICRYYNGVNSELGFPGLDASRSRQLVAKALDAISQASKGYNQERVIINGVPMETGTSFGGDEGRCTDFMSPSDCNLMFNVCDPVICPSSRCDLGGNYRVDNVIQTGIIGSLLLCLPNAEEGIAVPICLSGVHAGIDGYVSILNSTQQCLQESLETGRNVGICDEIKSVYMCQFFWEQAAPLAEVAIPRIVESFYSQGVRGGGEYLTVQSAWDNMQSSIDYFKNDYAISSFQAFNARSTQEIGGEVCNSFISARYPASKDYFNTLIEPDSPVQYSAWFSEDVLTTATVPSTSHYKVYYHIYAGNDIGSYYTVYLKDLPESNFVHSQGIYVVDRNYISRGGQVDKAVDFSAVSGYKQLCININGQDQCGFGKVSTSYFLNTITDAYAKEQAEKKDIDSERECVAGTSSLLSLAQPNVQAGAGEVLEPELYNHGIVRICSTFNPGKQVEDNGQFNFANSSFDRYKEVGHCGDPSVKCWLDTSSVKNVIKDKGIEKGVLDQVDLNRIGESNILDYIQSNTIGSKVESFVNGDSFDSISLQSTESEIQSVIDSNVKDAKRLSSIGNTNSHRARGMLLLGKIYNRVAEKLIKLVKVEESKDGGDKSGDEKDKEEVDQSEILEVSQVDATPLYFTYDDRWKWSPDEIVWMSTSTTFVTSGDFAGQSPVDENIDLINRLNLVDEKEGIKIIEDEKEKIEKLKESESGQSLDDGDVSDEGDGDGVSEESISDVLIVNQPDFQPIYFRHNGGWEWSPFGDEWFIVPATSVTLKTNQIVALESKNNELVRSLENKNYTEGLVIVNDEIERIRLLGDDSISQDRVENEVEEDAITICEDNDKRDIICVNGMDRLSNRGDKFYVDGRFIRITSWWRIGGGEKIVGTYNAGTDLLEVDWDDRADFLEGDEKAFAEKFDGKILKKEELEVIGGGPLIQ